MIRSHDLTGFTFSHLTFLDCNFIDIDFRYTNFISCDFTNCNFTDCQFDTVDMAGAIFTQCELIQPQFHKVRFLEYVTLSKSKIWSSKKCIEINTFDNVSKIIHDLED